MIGADRGQNNCQSIFMSRKKNVRNLPLYNSIRNIQKYPFIVMMPRRSSLALFLLVTCLLASLGISGNCRSRNIQTDVINAPTHIVCEDENPVTPVAMPPSRRGPVTVQVNSDFMMEVFVGDPGRKHAVRLDTASNVMWLFDHSMKGTLDIFDAFTIPFQRSLYWPTNSQQRPLDLEEEKEDGGTRVEISNSQRGEFSGILSLESIQIGGSNRVDGVALAVVDRMDMTSIHDSAEYDGVLGLGLASMNDHPSPLWLAMSLQRFGKEEENRHHVSFYLSRSGLRGEVTFGGINRDLIDGPLSFFPTLPKQQTDGIESWAIGMRVSIEGSTMKPKQVAAFIDSGSDVIYAPASLVKAIKAFDLLGEVYFNGKDYYVENERVEVFKMLPEIRFDIGDGSYSLKVSEYFKKNGPYYYDMQIVAHDKPYVRLGRPFFRKYYTVLDYGIEKDKVPQVGFARSNHNQFVKKSRKQQEEARGRGGSAKSRPRRLRAGSDGPE